MSNSNTIQVLLKAVDLVSNPFKKIQTASESLSEDIGITQMQLAALNDQASRIDGFQLTQTLLGQTDQQLNEAQISTQALAIAFKNTEAPTREQAQAFQLARDNVNQLQLKQNEQRISLQRQRQELSITGLNTRALTNSERQLRNSLSLTTTRLAQQRQELERVNAQQEKISRVKKGLPNRQTLVTLGAAGSRGASTMVNAAITLLKPGYEATERQAAVAQKTATGQNTASPTLPLNSLGGDLDKLSATWQQLSVDIFAQQEGSLRGLVQTATDLLGKLDGWVQRNGDLVQSLGTIAAVATGVMGVIGAIGYVAGPVITGINILASAAGFIGPLFEGIGLVISGLSLPVVAVVGLIVGAALLIRKFWEPLSAFFSGVFTGVAESVKPLLDTLGLIFQKVFGWLDSISAPITSTQESLNNCREAGVLFGRVLSDAFLFPLKSLRELSDGASWVLEKLGWIDKKSATLSDVTQKQETSELNTYVMKTSELPSYQGDLLTAYTPVAASNNNNQNFSDNRVNNVHITLQGNSTSAEEVASACQDHLNQVSDMSLALQRASFNHR